jgi:MFS family permease
MSAITVDSIKVQERNFRLLYLETFLGSSLGIAQAFAGAFAIRLGASNTAIGLLSSIPSLLVILVSIPIGRFMHKTQRKLFWALAGITIQRLGYILLAASPWVNITSQSASIFYVGLTVLLFVPLQYFSIGSVGMLIDLIPINRRAGFFTIRNMITSLVSIAGVFLAGQWLSHHTFPGNYQLVFIFFGILSFSDLFVWLSIKFPPKDIEPLNTTSTKLSLYNHIKELVKVIKNQPTFARLILNCLLLNLGVWAVSPLYVLNSVRRLQASDAWVGLSGTVVNACGLVGLWIARRLVERWGDSLATRRTVLVFGITPILIGLTNSLNLILIYMGLMNLLNFSFCLAVNNLYLKVLPKDNREDGVAIYNTIINTGAFIFPLIGVACAGQFGIAPTIVGCGILTAIGSLSFWVWRIDAD